MTRREPSTLTARVCSRSRAGWISHARCTTTSAPRTTGSSAIGRDVERAPRGLRRVPLVRWTARDRDDVLDARLGIERAQERGARVARRAEDDDLHRATQEGSFGSSWPASVSEPSSTAWKWRCWIGSAHSTSCCTSSRSGALVELAQHRPVPDLAGLGHRQELEAVQRVGVLAEVGLHHLGRLGLGLAGLVEDRGLLAVDLAGDLGAARLGLVGLVVHAPERRAQIGLVGQGRDLVGGGLGRLRQSQHLGQLLLENGQLSHRSCLPWVVLVAAAVPVTATAAPRVAPRRSPQPARTLSRLALSASMMSGGGPGVLGDGGALIVSPASLSLTSWRSRRR